MKYKKTIILLALVVFLLSIAGVSASEIDDTIASEDANTIELSTDNDIEDNLQTSEENEALASTDYDEAIAQTDTEVLGEGSAKYSDLAEEIGHSGNITLIHKNYTYDEGRTIDIDEDNKVIDGNGAVIDMDGSTIRAFYISGSGVTIKNLTIINANYNGNGGAIYFTSLATSGTVSNCNFVDNKVIGVFNRGGAVYFDGNGNVTNCNFVDNKATGDYSYGGAVFFNSNGNVSNCNFTNNSATGDGGAVFFNSNGNVSNCNFTNNTASEDGGAVWMSSGTVSNCNFTGNTASRDGGAVYFLDQGTVTNCNFTGNTATREGGAVYFYQGTGSVTICNFTDNKATGTGDYDGGGAVYFYQGTGSVTNCNFTDNSATVNGGAVYFYDGGNVSNCNFTDNTANVDGGAVYFDDESSVSNCNFIDNKATGDSSYGGAIRMSSGTVSNCNFTGNTATYYGGAVYFGGTGTVSNCNFTDNSAHHGGAVYFNQGTGNVSNCNFTDNSAGEGGAILMVDGTVSNCNFTDNSAGNGGAIVMGDGTVSNCNFTGNNATGDGGAVQFDGTGTVSNCNFTDNTANNGGGAIRFCGSGNVTNCNFTGNTATAGGGAVYFQSTGTVSSCNFTGNTVKDDGGAVFFSGTGTVAYCNFIDNKATGNYSYGGAIRMSSGTVTNCNFTNNKATGNYPYGNGGAIRMYSGRVSNCNFTGNNATTGSAIYFYKRDSSDTLTVSDSTFLNNRANAGALDIVKTENNITITFTGQNNLLNAIYSRNYAEVAFYNVTYWGANGITTISSTMSGSNKAAGQNITVGVVVNNELVLSKVMVTKENGTIVLNISAGENYYISARHNTDSYYTEAETTISNNTKFNVNVTSKTTNNKTVNITAKSNIPNDVVQGKLLFILPNGDTINATYASNGTWWAVHTFDDYGDYQVNASYIGLDNVTITNATISIVKANSTVNVSDVVMDYGDSINVTVTAEGAKGINATIDNKPVTVINNYTIMIPDLAAGNYTLTVTTIADDDHKSVNKTVNVTVNKAHTEITINTTSLELIVGDETIINATLTPAGAGNVTFTSSNVDIVEVDNQGNVIAQGKGQAIITVSYAGNNNYTAAENKTITVTVSLNDASVTVDKNTSDLKVGETYAINATKHPDTILLTITYTSSNNAVATVDKNGIVTAVGEGTAIITVEVGDDEIYAKNSTNVTVTVSKIPTEIAATAITTVYNVNKDLVITLKDGEGNPLSGVKVTVDLNGAKTYTTDKNGQVKVSTKGIAPKAYTAKVTFNGNTNYDKSTKDIKVTVKKATPKLTAKKKTYKTTPKTKKYTIVLKDNTGKAIKKAKVTLKVKGKTYKATTNSKGKATFKITKLNKKGTFKATITYKGNKYYNKVSKKAKIKVIVTFKTVSKGSKDKATVKEIQQALKDKGYYLTYQGHYLKVDGKFNSCTFRSIKEFQKDKGLKVTGKVDEKTARKLGII